MLHTPQTSSNRRVTRRVQTSTRPDPLRVASEPTDQPQLKRHQRQYRKRKAAGLCVTCGCHANAEPGHTRCRKHLRALAKQKKAMCERRARESVCVECGQRPSFWGVLCIVCRQRNVSSALPPGAKRALQAFREAERIRALELSQVEVRFGVRKLLIGGELNRNRERALRLYTGLDDNHWRTYSEVARIMKISKEAVRKLLLPSKLVLEEVLGDNVPWKIKELDDLNKSSIAKRARA